MKKWVELTRLQIKAAFQSLPKIIGGTLLLTVLAALVGVCAAKVMENTDNQQKMVVAVVVPENNSKYIEGAFEYLAEIETIREVCTFVKLEDETAMDRLREGGVTAVIRIPENFIHDIMVGVNTPAEVVFAKSGVNNSSILFQELVTAAAVDLSTAEAGIYSVDDACRSLGLTMKELAAAEADMNKEYLTYVLERGTYFVTEDLADTGSLNMVQFYVCTGIVMLLLFSGITCIELLKKDNSAMSVALKREGIYPGVLGAAKVLGVTVVFFCLCTLVLTLAMLSTIRFPWMKNVLSGVGFLKLMIDLIGIFVLLYSVFSFVYCLYRLTAHPVYGVLLLFILGMAMMFASGCFMPAALLPRLVQTIGEYLPTAWYFKLSGQILLGTVSLGCIVINIVYSALFLGIAAIQERRLR